MKISELPNEIIVRGKKITGLRDLAEKRRSEYNKKYGGNGVELWNGFEYRNTIEGESFWKEINIGNYSVFTELYPQGWPEPKDEINPNLADQQTASFKATLEGLLELHKTMEKEQKEFKDTLENALKALSEPEKEIDLAFNVKDSELVRGIKAFLSHIGIAYKDQIPTLITVPLLKTPNIFESIFLKQVLLAALELTNKKVEVPDLSEIYAQLLTIQPANDGRYYAWLMMRKGLEGLNEQGIITLNNI